MIVGCDGEPVGASNGEGFPARVAATEGRETERVVLRGDQVLTFRAPGSKLGIANLPLP